MRLLVLLSPTDKWGTKNEYSVYRKALAKDGFIRIAPEAYMRVVPNRKASEKHYRRLKKFAPSTGAVRVIRLTEKQFANVLYISGEPDYQEKTVGVNCNIVL